jgi:hypothetical protein
MATEGNEIDLNNIPDTAEAALALLAQIEAGDDPAKAPAPAVAEVKPDPVAEVKAGTTPTTETQKTEPTEAEAAGVATKDGKHVIPYSVLQSEREQKTAATRALAEAHERVAALEKSLQAVANGAKPGDTARAATAVNAEVSEMSDADLEALKEDFPTVYKALKATQAHAATLEAQIREQAGFKQEVEAASKRNVEETIQDVIDSNPKLAHIQANDADAFTLASQIDDTLKANPKWAGRPMSERFAKVIEMVEQANGAITVPGGTSKQQDAPTAADLKAAALATATAAAKAAAKHVPTSLSEFPVGDPPAQDETDALDKMSQFDLAAKLGRMTPAQQEAYFATLG